MKKVKWIHVLMIGLLVAILTSGSIIPATAQTPIQYALPNGFFFKQANGLGGEGETGFPVVNEFFGSPFGPVNFYDTFVARGGAPQVGFPAGRTFNYRGFNTQVFQKLVFQNQPGRGIFFVNVFDIMHDEGFDPFLDAFRQIPPPFDTSPDTGLPFNAVIARHLAFLNNDEAIRARYFADPDPINDFGLPMSFKDYGPFFVIRCQRASFQHFKVTVGPNPAGIVQIVNGGDLGKELGLFPTFAVTPVVPTFNANIVVFAPSPGSTVINPFTIVGDARLFEAVGNWELVNAAGAVINAGNFQAGAGGPEFGRFDAQVSFTIPSSQSAALRVFSLSPANGSRINELSIPLTISP